MTKTIEFFNVSNSKTALPSRHTSGSAGYDFTTPKSYGNITLEPQTSKLIVTGIKAKFPQGYCLQLHIRHSIAKRVHLINNVGIIDSDYFDNPSNEGNITFCIYNFNNKPITIHSNEAIVQGIFVKYYQTSNDNCTTQRLDATNWDCKLLSYDEQEEIYSKLFIHNTNNQQFVFTRDEFETFFKKEQNIFEQIFSNSYNKSILPDMLYGCNFAWENRLNNSKFERLDKITNVIVTDQAKPLLKKLCDHAEANLTIQRRGETNNEL